MKTLYPPIQSNPMPNMQAGDVNKTPNTRPTLFQEDKQWLEKVEHFVQKNLKNNHYTIGQLALDLAISERHLRRRLKSLISIGPKEFIRRKRLSRAQQLLYQRKYKTITQVAHAVGYRDVGTFRISFLKQFGKAPKAYIS